MAAAAVRQRTEVVTDNKDADADAADSGERHDAAAAPPAKKQSQSRTRLEVAQDAVETCTKKLTEARDYHCSDGEDRRHLQEIACVGGWGVLGGCFSCAGPVCRGPLAVLRGVRACRL